MTFIGKITILVFFVIIIFPRTSPADSFSVKGVYSLMRGMDAVDPSVVKLPFLAGVSIRAPWRAIEPEEGKMGWDYLDKALSEVKTANKKAMLRILPGINSPAWAYKKGIPSVEIKDVNQYHKTYGQKQKIPLPWDETYLNEWVKFVSQLGARYNSHDELVLVHIAGPTYHSAEMHLPKKANAELMVKAGYTKEKIVTAWKKVIDAYAKAFPDKDLALNVAIPLREDGAMEEIIQYGISKLGKHLCIQGNWLSAKKLGSFHPYRVIREYGKKYGVTVGFQMLDSAKDKPGRQGSLETSIEQGLKAGAHYFEVYQADIKEQKNTALFDKLDKKLR